ncbi:MAG: hypothetical protein HY056_00810 [Proteobacteria bacterium]|nr:hypothetical protein [Pseudomonadota bacterium]
MATRAGAAALAIFAFCGPALAQARVEPRPVAPEFRAAAEQRAKERKKLLECRAEANAKKILVRDRTKFLTQCIER